jgi:hypothetical protein
MAIFIFWAQEASAYPLAAAASSSTTDGDNHLVESGDFNQDGNQDVVVSTGGLDGGFYFLAGNGDGTFQPSAFFGTKGYSVGIDVADMDGANGPDVVVASTASQSISVYFNDGTGNFSAPDIYSAPGVGGSKIRSSRLVIDEFDGQPGLDVAVTLTTADKYAVFVNDGTGILTLSNTFSTEKQPIDIKSADFDNDGDKDLVYANFASGTVGVDINDGAGNFTNVAYFTSLTGVSPTDLTVGDYDKDGFVDFTVSQYNDSMISSFRNDGVLGFTATEYAGVLNPGQLDTADVNNDTFLDILVADSTLGGDAAILLNDGAGALMAPATYTNTISNGFGAKFVDLNADCYLDAVTGEHGFLLDSFLATPSAALSVTGASVCATTTATLATTEGTSAATNTIELVGTPTADVTITCALTSSVEVTTTPSPLVFTVLASDPNAPQTVTVTAIDDTDVEALDTTTLMCTTTSADTAYEGLSLSMNVTIADNDKVVTTPIDPVCKPAKLGNEIYNDLNCNGKNESTEKGFGGVKVELRDEHGHEVDQDTTKSNGEYSLYAPEPGRYQVVVKQEDVDMYLQTAEPGNDAELNNTTWVEVEECGEKITNLDFGYSAKECHLAVSGYDAMCVWKR